MNEDARIDREALAKEITRYLAAVDAFRSVGCEPVWRPEPGAEPPRPRAVTPATAARVAH